MFRASTLGLALIIILSVQLIPLAPATDPPTITLLTNNSARAASALTTKGGQKLIEDQTGRLIAVYIDNAGHIAITYSNGLPTTGGWSNPIKSPAPTKAYTHPAAVLVSLDSLRIIVEGGTGLGQVNDLQVTIHRDALANIVGITYGTPVTLDASGLASYPSAILAHNGDILAAWNWADPNESHVKSLRWKSETGWIRFSGPSSLPDDVVIDTTNPSLIFPNIVERHDNHAVYLMGNRDYSSVPSLMVFNEAFFDGSNWQWGPQDLEYELDASRGIEDAVSLDWDDRQSSVVALYDKVNSTIYGVFRLDAMDIKSRLDTPGLDATEENWGSLLVDETTGNYNVFFIDAVSPGGAGSVKLAVRTSDSWNPATTTLDSDPSNIGISIRRTGTPLSIDILFSRGTNPPASIYFMRIGPLQTKAETSLTISTSRNPSVVAETTTVSGRLRDAAGNGIAARTVTVQDSITSGSWNPYVTCDPTLTTVDEVVGTEANDDGGAKRSGGAFAPIGDRDFDKRSLTPPCTVRGNTTFVEIHNVRLATPLPPAEEEEDCSTKYNPVNGGGKYLLGSSECDSVYSIEPPNTQGECTLARKDACLHRLLFEIDQDWKGAGYCGAGTVCDDSTLPANSTEPILIDVQGFVFWDPGHVREDWHSFSGWELHPLTAWRFAGQTLFRTVASTTTSTDGSYSATIAFSSTGTFEVRSLFTGDTTFTSASSETLSQTAIPLPGLAVLIPLLAAMVFASAIIIWVSLRRLQLSKKNPPEANV